jgi:hypothetical protein
MAGRIFVSYRRKDTSGYAHLVYTLLSKEFGSENVFMDVDTIEPGEDFVEALDRALSICDVLIVLIGPSWMSIQDASGAKRLEDPKDYVRLEIASAINHKKKIIPVLFDGAAMPGQPELSSDIRVLARRQAVRIGERAADDIQRLLFKTIRQSLQDDPNAITIDRSGKKQTGEPSPPKTPVLPTFLRNQTFLVSLALGACLLLAVGGVFLFGRFIFGPPGGSGPNGGITVVPGLTPTATSGPVTGQDTVWQWRIDGDRAVLVREQAYWEKYESDTGPSGLYLRTDSVDVFGDFLELNTDGTFTLQQGGTVQVGTWTITGDQVTLTFS